MEMCYLDFNTGTLKCRPNDLCLDSRCYCVNVWCDCSYLEDEAAIQYSLVNQTVKKPLENMFVICWLKLLYGPVHHWFPSTLWQSAQMNNHLQITSFGYSEFSLTWIYICINLMTSCTIPGKVKVSVITVFNVTIQPFLMIVDSIVPHLGCCGFTDIQWYTILAMGMGTGRDILWIGCSNL